MLERMKNASVPFIWGNSSKSVDGCSIEMYKPEEMTKLFIAQCYELGIPVACEKFAFDTISPVVARLQKNYCRFISGPWYKDLTMYAQLNYEDDSLIDLLNCTFERKLQTWADEKLLYGTECTYTNDEILKILEHNFGIRKVSGYFIGNDNEPATHISDAYMNMLDKSIPEDVIQIFKAYKRLKTISYSKALLLLNSDSKDKDVHEAYFYAAMLMYYDNNVYFDTVLKRIGNDYGF